MGVSEGNGRWVHRTAQCFLSTQSQLPVNRTVCTFVHESTLKCCVVDARTG